MALPSNSSISMELVNIELSKSPTAVISLNDTDVRTLAGKLSGQISMTDLWGKGAYWIGVLSTTVALTGSSIKVAPSGNIYIHGFNAPSSTSFIAKFNAAGILQWQRSIALIGTTAELRYLGGMAAVFDTIDIDTSENVYICGGDLSTNTQACVAKYDTNGNIQWQRSFGLGGKDYGNSIAVHSDGNIAIASTHEFTDAYDYARVVCLNSSGTVSWAQQWRERYSYCLGTAFDSAGSVYAVGGYNAGSDPVYPQIYKFNSSGTAQWKRNTQDATPTPVNATGISSDVVVASSGNVYACNLGSYGFTPKAGSLIKYNSTGDVQWSKALTGTGADRARSVALDGSENIYVAYGLTTLKFAKYNSSGTLQWQRELTGTKAGGIYLDSENNMYVIGDVTVGGVQSVIIAKLPSNGTLTGTYTVANTSISYSAASLTDTSLTTSVKNNTPNNAATTITSSTSSQATSTPTYTSTKIAI